MSLAPEPQARPTLGNQALSLLCQPPFAWASAHCDPSPPLPEESQLFEKDLEATSQKATLVGLGTVVKVDFFFSFLSFSKILSYNYTAFVFFFFFF